MSHAAVDFVRREISITIICSSKHYWFYITHKSHGEFLFHQLHFALMFIVSLLLQSHDLYYKESVSRANKT